MSCTDWHASYVASHLERDVRQVIRIGDLLQFQRFMRMMAARCGQLLNLNAVANDLVVAQTTARAWLTVLEATYVVFRLPPFHTNFGKRLVKTPKFCFYDTGLAAWLPGILAARTMNAHPMPAHLAAPRGAGPPGRAAAHLRRAGQPALAWCGGSPLA